jgi:pheromone a factor receptor
MTVACAFIFFGFFGFADEARTHYRLAINSITKTLGISSFTLTSTSGGGSSHPVPCLNQRPARVAKFALVSLSIHKEMYNRDSVVSMDVSFNDAGGLLGEKKDDEKASTFAPTLSYGAMTLNDAGGTLSDVGGTLPDYSEYPISSVPSSGPRPCLQPLP